MVLGWNMGVGSPCKSRGMKDAIEKIFAKIPA
jgi:hypothetical protein